MADATYQPKVYRKQGGDELVVASGGKINIESGGTLELAGVDLAGELAALNGLDSTELGFLNGITAGSITASKAVTRDAASNVPLKGAVLAAAGNSQGTAAAIASQVTLVTGADNTTAVVLPTAVVGQTFVVVNTVANKTLPVYPATGAAINGGSANAAFTLGPGKAGIFHCTALLTWYVDGQAAATPNTTELALLTGAGTGGTVVASKAQIGDANQNIGAVKCTGLSVGTSGSETAVTATAAEINELDDIVASFTFAYAAGGENVAEVTITAKDAAGATVDAARPFMVWLSDADTGVGLTGTAASGTVQAKSASGADFATFTAKKCLLVQPLATGIYILEITDSAKTAYYPCASTLDGRAFSVGAQMATGNYGTGA